MGVRSTVKMQSKMKIRQAIIQMWNF